MHDNAHLAGPARNVAVAIAAACSLRVGVVASTWLHEIAHLLIAVLVDNQTTPRVMTAANITGEYYGSACADLSDLQLPCRLPVTRLACVIHEVKGS